ncbi:MAG: Penicillin amidase family protein [Candidatus Uhrbacteria bacterium GW2011_GWE2_45_35]|uniref:Penicillin amidase family protein n=2 Tax=Candidatus Uhriibacteriota TaxID=1752732 RepID=A0A0G1JKT3_9BACT|nr:MAG: Penicillin amidase family protein [Candidatus Uhrbacteria bacterium GW2011_GWF2_44_350]KKU09221.1 MAG: Penicillin amidase family protein [Candidatus Uhrbacteria bacterium GW2011_GWE2_45_35]HBR80496.1 hypothetical protein [Candidatus Uhrbacteria bacterium]HCU31519.1 hypothetical protein [Candidatus Uhrbacteria bacterium]
MGIGRREEKPFTPERFKHPDPDNKGIPDAEFSRREKAAQGFEKRVLAVDPKAFEKEQAEKRRGQERDMEIRIRSQKPLSEFLKGLLDKEDEKGKMDEAMDAVGEEFFGIHDQTTIAELKSIVEQRLLRLEAEKKSNSQRLYEKLPDFDYSKEREADYEERKELAKERTTKEESREEDVRNIDRILSNGIVATESARFLLSTVLDADKSIKDCKAELDKSIELRQFYQEKRAEEIQEAASKAKKNAV